MTPTTILGGARRPRRAARADGSPGRFALPAATSFAKAASTDAAVESTSDCTAGTVPTPTIFVSIRVHSRLTLPASAVVGPALVAGPLCNVVGPALVAVPLCNVVGPALVAVPLYDVVGPALVAGPLCALTETRRQARSAGSGPRACRGAAAGQGERERLRERERSGKISGTSTISCAHLGQLGIGWVPCGRCQPPLCAHLWPSVVSNCFSFGCRVAAPGSPWFRLRIS